MYSQSNAYTFICMYILIKRLTKYPGNAKVVALQLQRPVAFN